jgi:ribonuclease HI
VQPKILFANMIYETALNIYVDGSSYSNPRRGGIGIRYVTVDDSGNEVCNDETLPGYRDATNNQMELMACIKALEGACSHEQIGSLEKVFVFTDSMYVTDNLSRAMFQWSKQGWNNSSGRPIENAELWKNLIRQMRKVPRKVEFKWVKGHSRDVHNRAADKLAKQSAKGVLNKPLRVTTVRRKITPMSVEVGSVGMHGQELSVKIITDTYLKMHKL